MLFSSEQKTVKEKQLQLSDIFKLLGEINKELIDVDDDDTKYLWFSEVDEKISPLSIKSKIGRK